jgi:DNA polymerase-1
MDRVAVIDADIILYKACRVAETEVDFGNDQWVLWSNLNLVKTIIDDQVDLIVDQMEADRSLLCFSDVNNFRKDVNPEYKANRKGGRKPLAFKPALQFCKDTYPYRVFTNLEADDTIGIIGTTENENDYVIVSEDKDLLTIPGLHWDFNLKKIFSLDEEEADFNFYKQALMGDTVDNYKGCPKVGKVSAEKILRDAQTKGEDLWDTVVNKYMKAGLTEEDAIMNARMARILRRDEYDLVTHKVKLWKQENND